MEDSLSRTFICSKCGLVQTLPLNRSNKREINHTKTLYCHKCKMTRDFNEVENSISIDNSNLILSMKSKNKKSFSYDISNDNIKKYNNRIKELILSGHLTYDYNLPELICLNIIDMNIPINDISGIEIIDASDYYQFSSDKIGSLEILIDYDIFIHLNQFLEDNNYSINVKYVLKYFIHRFIENGIFFTYDN